MKSLPGGARPYCPYYAIGNPGAEHFRVSAAIARLEPARPCADAPAPAMAREQENRKNVRQFNPQDYEGQLKYAAGIFLFNDQERVCYEV
jgi:hypothetical protein